MRRKLTCRMIAQWAINCVDMRDSDATMTPFEYDENPWDGWGVPLHKDGKPSEVIVSQIPIDGDSATDENLGAVIDWVQVSASGSKVVVGNSAPGVTPPVSGPIPAPLPLDESRGLVWGAERPELLITETMAFHDRRTEDLGAWKQLEANNPQMDDDLDQRLRPKGSAFIELYNPSSPEGQQPADLYSKLLRDPKIDGPVGIGPSQGIELGRLSTLGMYARIGTPEYGTLTNRIDAPGVTNPTVQRSPVWRMIVVEENFLYRNDSETWDNQVDPQGTGVHIGNPKARYANASRNYFEPVDPDRGGGFWGQEVPTVAGSAFPATKLPTNEPYVERAFYFTTDNSDRWKKGEVPTNATWIGGKNELVLQVKDPEAKLRIPPMPFDKPLNMLQNEKPFHKPLNHLGRYFISGDVRNVTTPGGNEDQDVAIAPVLPGRYAIVGTAGAQYTNATTGQPLPVRRRDANGDVIQENSPRFITTISRPLSGANGTQTIDNYLVNNINKARRIELLPSANTEVQQVLVAGNGGTPLFPDPGRGGPLQRENEVVKRPDGKFRNIYAGGSDPDDPNYVPIPDTELIPPCVAIPVKDMSMSEPLDFYRGRRTGLKPDEDALVKMPGFDDNSTSHFWDPLSAQGEGQYTVNVAGGGVESPFDVPFDEAPELKRNGTTRNYRTVYLQRLADPSLPWNPLPMLPDGKLNPKHNAKLPVNLYLTIDTSSVDLTTFNGTSRREPDMNQTTVQSEAKQLPDAPNSLSPYSFDKVFGYLGRTAAKVSRLSFRSLERGFHASAKSLGNPPNNELPLVPRAMWRQEPINRFDPTDPQGDVVDPANTNHKNDMAEWVSIQNDQEHRTALLKRVNDLRIRDVSQLPETQGAPPTDGELLKDIAWIASSGLDGDFNSFPDGLKPRIAHFDIVMSHSLGFQNESFGALATTADVQQQGLPAAAEGTPMPDKADGTQEKFSRTERDDADVSKTFPWLAWVNRPYISAEELLQVTATSSSQMLRQFSTIDPSASIAESVRRFKERSAPISYHRLDTC